MDDRTIAGSNGIKSIDSTDICSFHRMISTETDEKPVNSLGRSSEMHYFCDCIERHLCRYVKLYQKQS